MVPQARPELPSAAEATAFSAEANVAWVRAAVIAFNVAVYYLALAPQGVPWLAAAVSGVASVYAVVVLVWQPYRHLRVMTTSLWTATTDGVLITLWIHATGGFESPFHLLWYLSLVGVTFRYSARGPILAAVLYAGLYAGLLWLTGDLAGHEVEVVVRVTYILLLGALGALLARESLRVFEERFQLGGRAREAERLRMLADASTEGVMVERDGMVVEANRAVLEILGRPRDQVIGRSVLDFAAPASLPAVKERLRQHDDAPLEAWIRRPDGSTRLVRAQARLVEHEGRPARLAAVRDITEERAAEQERERAREAEMEVRRLREMDRFKGQFINSAAHELNTPLTPIQLQMHMLKKRIHDGPERKAVDVLDRNVGRLAHLVKEMLEVARLESGRLQLEPVPMDLVAAAVETLETYQDLAESKGVRLDPDLPEQTVIVADPKRVAQVLDNLVSNAIKFTPKGGSVSLRVRAYGSHAEAEVADTGVGIPPERMAMLFQPFSQLHREELGLPGNGLGLFIARGMAERHGGTLVARSQGRGQGTTFTLRLPVAGPPPSTPAARA